VGGGWGVGGGGVGGGALARLLKAFVSFIMHVSPTVSKGQHGPNLMDFHVILYWGFPKICGGI